MAVTQYVGARYVPLFADPVDWTSDRAYEPLTIVLHEGNSYTTKQYTPKGIDISDTRYWALTANYNAQMDAYRSEVTQFDGRITANGTAISAEVTRATAAEKANADAISAEVTRATAAEKANADAISMERDRALIAEQENATSINNLTETAVSEVARLNSLVNANTTAISAETTRATAAETNLTSELNTIRYKDQYPLMLSYSNYTNEPGNVKLYCSYDFINYMDCGLVKDENNKNIYADAKNVCITNDSLYLIGSGIVYKATDNLRRFKKIADLTTKIANATGFANIYGVSLYYDIDSGFLYVYGACSNSTTNDFKIYGCRVDNHTLEFIDSPIPITLQGYDNVIDPFVIRHNNILYMAFKDETNHKVRIATGTSPLAAFTPNETLFSHYGEGFEAPKLIEIDDRLIVFVDGYGVRADGNTRQLASSNDVGVFQCNGWFNVEQNVLCNIINFSRDINTKSFKQFSKARHPCYFKLTNFVKNLFDNTDIYPIMVKCEAPYAYMDTTVDNTGAKYIITNAPMLYRFNMGSNNITVGYSAVFNQNCVTYIEHAGANTTKISIDSSIIGGADSGRYICTEDREICSLIAQANAIYPNRVYYS